jgi:asparagine synthase (glutamine-hydrolysing)
VPSFTIGFEGTGVDERPAATEAAATLGSPLTVVTMDRHKLAEAYPELVAAAEVPVLDTSCAALMRLARAVHDQGYKVVLTGEGADEALAGYVWYKTQALRNWIGSRIGDGVPRLLRKATYALIGGGQPKRRPPQFGMNGTRPAQQDMYEMFGQARTLLFSPGMWESLDDHQTYDDLDLTNDRMTRWHPLNQSLYVGYKVMLPGLLMLSKGDRIAMHSSIEARYPFLDEDVIAFCARIAPEYKLRGLKDKWLLRQVAARTLPPRIAGRPKTMFRAGLAETFLGPGHPSWVDQLLSVESLRKTGYFDPAAVRQEAATQQLLPRITPRRFVLDLGLTSVVSTQLWHHLFCGGGLCELPSWTAPEFAGNRLPGRYKTREEVGEAIPEPAVA